MSLHQSYEKRLDEFIGNLTSGECMEIKSQAKNFAASPLGKAIAAYLEYQAESMRKMAANKEIQSPDQQFQHNRNVVSAQTLMNVRDAIPVLVSKASQRV